MSDYRNNFRRGERDYYWTLPRIAIGIVAASVLFGTAGFAVHLLSQPGRMVSKTLDADNVIRNYEWFHDAHGNYKAKVAQIKQFKGLIEGEQNPGEKSRLRIDTAAIQQSCRDLANRYNANVTKINRGLFKGETLPESLNLGACE